MPTKARPSRDRVQEVDYRLEDAGRSTTLVDVLKREVALTFRVRPEAIEITIRA